MISIHGRASYSALIKNESQDLSTRTVYFEIPSAGIRKLLPADSGDAKAKRLKLARNEVELIPTIECKFAVLDETDPIFPVLIASGTIARNGYTGAPA